jgi:bifunctional ADP-heptose synthase (sugar kinase/adenylyltransferase)
MAGSLANINNFEKAKVIVLANRVSDDVYSLSKKADYVVANVAFAQALTKLPLEFNKPKLMVNFMQKIKDLNKADYTIMMREHGVLYSSDRQVKMIPAIDIDKKIDDTNAGNIFFGAFCYGLINDYGIDSSVKMANIAAGLALTKLGSLDCVPPLEEVLTMGGITKKEVKTEEEPEATTETETPPTEAATPVTNDAPAANLDQAFGEGVAEAAAPSTPPTPPAPVAPATTPAPAEPTVSVAPPAENPPAAGNIFDS